MLSVIIPVRNEPSLELFLLNLHDVLAGIPGEKYEILIVQGDRETGFYLYPNMPHQRTIWTYGDSLERSILNGFSNAKGDKIIVMDSDGQHPPEIIPKILEELDNGSDLIVASRFIEGGSPGRMSPYRQLVTKSFKKVSSYMNVNSSDPMSGFFGLRRNILNGLEFKPFKWKVLYEILYKKRKSGLKVKEIPYSFHRRDEGISSTSSSLGIKILWDMLSVSGRFQVVVRSMLTIALFSFIVYMMNISQLEAVLSTVNLRFVAYGVICYTIMTSILAYRLYKVLRVYNTDITFWKVFFAHSFGMLSSDIGFGKIGYIAAAPVLSNNVGIKQDNGLSVILGIQSIEFIVKGLAASVSILAILRLIDVPLSLVIPSFIGIGLVTVLGVVGVFLLFYQPYWLEDVPILGDVAGYFQRDSRFKSMFTFIVVTSLFCWLIQGLTWYFIGQALYLEIPFLVFFALHPIITSAKFIPLTPASLGVFDLAVIWGLSVFGVPPTTALAFSLIERFNSLIDLVALKELLVWKTKTW